MESEFVPIGNQLVELSAISVGHPSRVTIDMGDLRIHARTNHDARARRPVAVSSCGRSRLTNSTARSKPTQSTCESGSTRRSSGSASMQSNTGIVVLSDGARTGKILRIEKGVPGLQELQGGRERIVHSNELRQR